jgi:hypothetical protein
VAAQKLQQQLSLAAQPQGALLPKLVAAEAQAAAAEAQVQQLKVCCGWRWLGLGLK